MAEIDGQVVGLTALHIGPEGCPCGPEHKEGMQAKDGMDFRRSVDTRCRRKGVGAKLMVSALSFFFFFFRVRVKGYRVFVLGHAGKYNSVHTE